MEQRKNKKMLLLVGILIAIIGISFAYFIVSSLIRGDGASGVMTTANINGATIDIEGTIEFNDLDILPGHKTISGIKLTATGNNELIPYNLIWEGTNTINTALKYTVYKTNTEVNTSATCNKIRGTKGGASISYEECEIAKLNELGTPISNGTILKNSEKEILASDEFITATTTGNIVYYYVILEYPNLDEPQNIDIGGSFNGTVKVEKSDANADIIVEATYIKGDDGTYKETQEIPTSGYILNEQSSCSNSATPLWEDNTLLVNNLTTKGTVCKLYFEKYSAKDKIIGDTTGIEEKTEFTGIATAEDTGIYSAPDDYGTSYYFRGLEGSLNNWVKFADSYWRIIRVNGNGTVRMIYNGAANGNPSSSNKTGTTTQINGATYMYNHTVNDNAYIGYMMGIPLNGTTQTQNTTSNNSTSYEQAHTNTYESDAKKTVDSWYKANIADKGLSKYIDVNTGFCNDRQLDKTAHSSYQGDGYGTQNSGYAPWRRVYQDGSYKTIQTPILQCTNKSRDLFTYTSANNGNKKLTYPVGLVTSDEAVFAGGFGGTNNSTYYLYTNKDYWTMSPSHYYSNLTYVFSVNSYGFLGAGGAHGTLGLRPVINLRADTVFTGSGSETDPFIVMGGNS